MTGWRRLITATVRLAHRATAPVQRRPADGRLLFEPVGETTSRSAERVRGIVTGAWALSAEICQACGGPGNPVTLGRGGRGTRCGDCPRARRPAPPPSRVAPGARNRARGRRPPRGPRRRPGPRRPDESAPHAGETRELAGEEKPGRPLHDDHLPDRRRRLEPSPARGPRLAVLLPLECPGVAPPWRAGQIKERLGRLKIHHRRHTPFYEGIGAILSDVSATTCIYCGHPGRMRRPGWMHPACDQCWTLEQRNPERVNPNREPIEGLVRGPAGPPRA